MPELPETELYVFCIRRQLEGRALEKIRLKSPFLLRSVDPPLSAAEGRTVRGTRRIGKRVVIEFEGALFLVFHPMIAGRFRWRRPGAGLPGKAGLAAFDFEHGTLLLTEAASKKRASLYVVQGEAGLADHDPGGLEVLDADLASFRARLLDENHTVKRALCDPKRFSGIGNAYSDEILLHAGISPLKWTSRLENGEIERLFDATRETLIRFRDRLREEVGDGFPEKVTAFRKDMAAHGKFGEPCPVCSSPIQRIVYASNEANYCARCQTGGKLLKDRALSQLLKDDWPRSLDEL